jgi:hypothetical protein
VETLCGRSRFIPERLVEEDFSSPARCAVEDGAAGQEYAEHFLKAHGLCAELYLECPFMPKLPGLVFNRKWPPESVCAVQYDTIGRRYSLLPVNHLRVRGDTMEFHHISFAGEAQFKGPEKQSARDSNITA